MLQPETHSPIEVTMSNLSLPIGVQLLGPSVEFESYAQDIGISGYEITPTKPSLFVGMLIRRGQDLEAAAAANHAGIAREAQDPSQLNSMQRALAAQHARFPRIVRSVHASPRLSNTGIDLVGRTMFPLYERSVTSMRYIQIATGKAVSAVFFPAFEGAQALHAKHENNFQTRLFQPKPADWSQRFGLSELASEEAIREALAAQRLTGAAWDVFHAQNPQDSKEFFDPQRLCAKLASAGLIESVHVSLGRTDCADRWSKIRKWTKEAKQAFLHSPEAAAETMEGQMLQHIVHNWKTMSEYQGRAHQVVIEVLPGLSYSRAKGEQEDIVHTVRSLIAAA